MKNSTFNVWQWIVIFYMLLIGLSLFVQFVFPVEQKPFVNQENKVVGFDNRTVNFQYIHFKGNEESTSLWMLPDALFGPEYLLPLAEKLYAKHGFDIIIPIYPETDTDNRQIDSSNNSRTNIIKTLADSLGVNNTELLGHGYGGLIAIELAANNAEIIRSLTLLSSYGTLELQLLGNHTFNRSLYALLYPVVAFFRYATPHMGFYHLQNWQEHYVRTLLNMDQRDIRNHLEKIEVPVLIMHPLDDRYVSLSVAEETHRLLPQSVLATKKADHHTIYSDADVWIKQIVWFLENVQNQVAENRGQAAAERKELSKKKFDAREMMTIGGSTLFLMIILLALLSQVSEDLACISGGLLTASGILPFWYAVLGCYLGILFADIGTYLIGRWIGSPILEYRPFKWLIKENDVTRAKNMFKMRGMEIIFATRFLPGTRFPTYLVAGILKTNFIAFIGYFVLAVTLWTPALVGISALVGQPMIHYLQVYQEYALWIFAGIALLIYMIFTLIMPLTTVKGRRKLYIRWVRFKDRYL